MTDVPVKERYGMSCEATDVLGRDMDIALLRLDVAGPEGLAYRVREDGAHPSRHSFPEGRWFLRALDELARLGLAQLAERPDKEYGPNGVTLRDRCWITPLGTEKAAAVAPPDNERSGG